MTETPRLWLYGWHAVAKALENPARTIHTLATLPEKADEAHQLCVRASQKISHSSKTGRKIKPTPKNRQFFARLFPPETPHQGIALECERLASPDIQDLLPALAEKALLVIIDQATDPRNIGAVLRSASAFGADGVILAGRGAPRETPAMAKAASGALDHIPVFRPVNLARTLGTLKKNGFWCIAIHETAEKRIEQIDYNGRIALVFGAEGSGIRKLTLKECDLSARINMPGFQAGSGPENLNMSNAVAIVLHMASFCDKSANTRICNKNANT